MATYTPLYLGPSIMSQLTMKLYLKMILFLVIDKQKRGF